MRNIRRVEHRDAVRDLCIGADLQLPGDLCGLIEKSTQTETDPLGREVLCDLCKNLQAAKELNVPSVRTPAWQWYFSKWGRTSTSQAVT